jgi:hypothetical protein
LNQAAFSLWVRTRSSPALSAASTCTDNEARKLYADVTAEITCGYDDAGFDLDLRLRLIKYRNQLANRVDVFANVCDDYRIAAAICFDRTASRKSLADDRKQPFGRTPALGSTG